MAASWTQAYHEGLVHHRRSPHGPRLSRQPAHAEKTASYYLVHITVAALVAYAVTGNLWIAFTLSLLEPTVQAVAFFFHEKAWDRAARRNASGGDTPPATSPAALQAA